MTPPQAPAGLTRRCTPLERLRGRCSPPSPSWQGARTARARASPQSPAGGAITLERPRRAEFGDYSTNAALLLAPGPGTSPREVAERLGEALAARLGASLERFEVAGPGFLNLFLADSWLVEALAEVLAAGAAFGAEGRGAPERDPGRVRLGQPDRADARRSRAQRRLRRRARRALLAFHGHRVEREFYVNDAGSQVRKLGESIARAGARASPFPRTATSGDYVEAARRTWRGPSATIRPRRGAPRWR